MQANTVFKEALDLSPVDKVKLMDLLLGSFNSEQAGEHEQAWANHAERVCDEVDAGAMLYSLETVMRELNQ
jgi:uncharacterized protein YdaL